jgi:hypothetical protein
MSVIAPFFLFAHGDFGPAAESRARGVIASQSPILTRVSGTLRTTKPAASALPIHPFMKRLSFSRVLESMALCLSAAALVFTVTIAVNVGSILVEQWPVLWSGQSAIPVEPPPPSTASPGSAKARHRHGHAVRTTALKPQASAKPSK